MSAAMLGINHHQEREMNLKETELCLGLPGTPKSSNMNGKRGYSETVDLKLNLDLDVSSPTRHSQESSAGIMDLNKENSKKGVSAAAAVTHDQMVEAKDPVPKPPAKAQVVGWPPVRSYRKNIMATTTTITSQKSSATTTSITAADKDAAFVKVSIDGAPYLRKVDLKMYKSYQELSDALGKMFSAFTGNYGAAGSDGMIDFMNETKLMDLLNSSDYVPTYEDKDGDWMLVGDVPWEMFVDSCKRLRIMKGSEAVGLAPRAMEKCKSRS